MLLSLKKLLFSHPPCRILVPYSKFYLFHLLVLWYFLPKTFLTKKDISLSLLFLVQLIVPLFLLHTGHRELVVQCFQFLLIHVLRHQLPIRRILPPHHILVNQVLIGQLLLGKVSFLHITSHHITRNSHPIYNFLSYHRISPYFSFVSSLSSITIPKNVQEALDHPGWRQAMIVEM